MHEEARKQQSAEPHAPARAIRRIRHCADRDGESEQRHRDGGAQVHEAPAHAVPVRERDDEERGPGRASEGAKQERSGEREREHHGAQEHAVRDFDGPSRRPCAR